MKHVTFNHNISNNDEYYFTEIFISSGASYDATKNLIPPEIDIACHNGPNSCTISGPTNIIQDFIKELQAKKIYVRAVNTSNIAYHSRYIASAGSKLISYLNKVNIFVKINFRSTLPTLMNSSQVIPQPKQRSEKWICTSALEHEWSTEKIKYSSAEYHTNNLLSPVYFEESSRCIPENAIIIEIAPHGLMQSILKQSLPSTVDNIPLTMKDHHNGVEFLLSALGQYVISTYFYETKWIRYLSRNENLLGNLKRQFYHWSYRLYEIGCNPKVSNLYPPIQFPVSRSTPMISPLIKWQHDEEWPVTKYAKKATLMTGERDVIIEKEDFGYLRDHIIDGRNFYPGLGYLVSLMEKHTLVSIILISIKYLPQLLSIDVRKWLAYWANIIMNCTNNTHHPKFSITDDRLVEIEIKRTNEWTSVCQSRTFENVSEKKTPTNFS